ncbi:FAD-binding oxidoreductase [Chloroflexota bacterium]
MALKEDLAGIIGSEYISDDPNVLNGYSQDYSLVQPRLPSLVVHPENTAEVQEVVKYANHHLIPITPRSSEVSFYGAGIPSQGGIIVDLGRMNKILEISPPDRKVKIEPGVTWSQLQSELEKAGMMVCSPLLPHPLKSALTSATEREPMLIPKGEYNDILLTAEVVLASGDLYWTGSAIGKGMKGQIFPEGLIPGSTRLFCGAQGTLGILTWASLKTEFIPKADKLLFIPLDSAEAIAEPIYQIQRRQLGSECLVLNNTNLATILAEKWPVEYKSLKKSLPPWTLLICLSGLGRLPEGRIQYEEAALKDVATQVGFKVLPTVADIPDLGARLIKMLRKPWPKDGYWKHNSKGACQDIFFYTTVDRSSQFTEAIAHAASEEGYPTGDIGVYLQPVERGRACFCQYNIYYNPDDEEGVDQVRRLFFKASERAMGMGGFFTTPYGTWAEMVYSRAASYTTTLKVVKEALDPNNILNPGKLCF